MNKLIALLVLALMSLAALFYFGTRRDVSEAAPLAGASGAREASNPDQLRVPEEPSKTEARETAPAQEGEQSSAAGLEEPDAAVDLSFLETPPIPFEELTVEDLELVLDDLNTRLGNLASSRHLALLERSVCQYVGPPGSETPIGREAESMLIAYHGVPDKGVFKTVLLPAQHPDLYAMKAYQPRLRTLIQSKSLAAK